MAACLRFIFLLTCDSFNHELSLHQSFCAAIHCFPFNLRGCYSVCAHKNAVDCLNIKWRGCINICISNSIPSKCYFVAFKEHISRIFNFNCIQYGYESFKWDHRWWEICIKFVENQALKHQNTFIHSFDMSNCVRMNVYACRCSGLCCYVKRLSHCHVGSFNETTDIGLCPSNHMKKEVCVREREKSKRLPNI